MKQNPLSCKIMRSAHLFRLDMQTPGFQMDSSGGAHPHWKGSKKVLQSRCYLFLNLDKGATVLVLGGQGVLGLAYLDRVSRQNFSRQLTGSFFKA